MSDLIAAVLTPAQQEAVEFYRALNVPASWFIGEPDANGTVEVLAIGQEPEATFIWSIRIEEDGQSSTSEARVDEFSTGIDV